jgi:hypothetical protein
MSAYDGSRQAANRNLSWVYGPVPFVQPGICHFRKFRNYSAGEQVANFAQKGVPVNKTLNYSSRAGDSGGSSSRLDLLTVHEYFGRWDGTGCLQPEKRLMFAVLLDAVECFQKYSLLPGQYAYRLFKDTEDWIFKDDHKWPFSFMNICEAVEMDPHYLRKGLSLWKLHAMQKLRPSSQRLSPTREGIKVLGNPKRNVLSRPALGAR